jgi:hypothetical protein
MIIMPTKKELPYVDYKLGKKCSIINEFMVIKYGCQLVDIRLSHLSVLVRVVNNIFYSFAHVQYRLFENLQAWLRGICSIYPINKGKRLLSIEKFPNITTRTWVSYLTKN